ncbi:MAG: T9SS type A sorting domain-containing protein, partial [Saprospiraceae bacterium]
STNYGTTTFTTQTPPASCSAPTGLSGLPISANEAFISWNPVSGASSYDLQYRLSTSGAFITIAGIPGTSYDLSPLMAGRTYSVRVRAFCTTTGSYSVFSAEASFTMPTSKPGENTGEKTISETITEDRTGQSALALAASINLVPNPASALVQVNLNLDKTENVRLELLDLYGKVIESQRVTLREGSVEFELADLPQGIYFVRTLAGNHAPVTKRLVKE